MYRSAFVLLLLTVEPALAAAEDPSDAQRAGVELWVQPLGSIIYGSFTAQPSAYVSAGATVRLPQKWELVLEGAFQWVPASYYGDGYGTATVWQFWVSVGALRFFQTGRPHDGFFVGPKLEGTYQQVGPCSGTTGPSPSTNDYECPAGLFPPSTGGALTITCEAGYRFQFGHFVLSFMFPSVGLGYAWNGAPFVYPYVIVNSQSLARLQGEKAGSGFGISLDFNTLRMGVSF